MIQIKYIKNPIIIFWTSIFLTFLIGILDYFSGIYTSSILLYIIPIAFIALYKGFDKREIYSIIIFATAVWAISNLELLHHVTFLNFLWNIFVRFAVFSVIGLLNFQLKKNTNRLIEINSQLKSVNLELKNLNEEKNKFIGIAAHDLRNPIGSIYSFSDLILSEYEELSQTVILKYIGHIKTLSNNSLNLLKNLLNVSKIESGKIELNKESIDYISFLNEVIQFINPLAAKKNILIKLESTEEKLVFNFDNHYLSEVINNLLTNALKFSFANSEIIVKVYITQHNTVKTEVIDYGQGIPAHEQELLFNYFQKSSTQPTSGESSTGLGLAIAKKIIVEHQGAIGVKSKLSKGATFYFELPFLK